MSKVNHCILNYLLARQKRAARHEIFERAEEAELLDCKLLGETKHGGSVWQLPENHLTLYTGDMDHDHNLIQKALEASDRNHGNRQHYEVVDEFEASINFDDAGNSLSDKPTQTKPRKSRSVKLSQKELSERRDHVLSIIASFAPSLKVNEVATALLLARAFDRDEKALSQLLSIIRNKAPIIGIRVPVHDFVRQFGQMLESGLVMPFNISLESIIHGNTFTGHYSPVADSKRRRSISCLSGFLVRGMEENELRAAVSKDVLAAYKPLIIADEKDHPLPDRLSAVADVMIEGDGIDAGLTAEVLAISCHIPIGRSRFLMNELDFKPSHLGIDDLAVAIRPGRSLTKIIGILMMLEDAHRGNTKKNTNSERGKYKKQYSGCFDVIDPQNKATFSTDNTKLNNKKPDESGTSNNDRSHLFIEQLAGYGQAREWALDLKQDIKMWYEGETEWTDLSSRLLLSGPPGTGKTTYAKALCNTLEMPLIATSVARWLESCDLGKVLAAISATFDYVSKNSPCVLFIDEIDNIGNRNGGSLGSKNDDYWASLINRLLELLDGASKTEGVVIVGATNRPNKIDAALLRSGRLEKHIVIPPPDTQALIGIIAHHLGADLNEVVESRLSQAITNTPLAKGINSNQKTEDQSSINHAKTGAAAHG